MVICKLEFCLWGLYICTTCKSPKSATESVWFLSDAWNLEMGRNRNTEY